MYINLAPFTMLCYGILVSSSLMALSSSSWLIFWLSMEVNLLSFIPIILSSSMNQETEASIKYFLAQALGSSAILVFSTSLWNLEDLGTTKLFSLILMVSVLLKLGSVPCHFWYPSVMASISWVSCFILTTWQKLAPLGAVSFFLMQKFSSSFLIFIGSMNAIMGGVMGLNQSKMRSIMAYSSIGHIGWMLSLSSIYMPISSVVYFVVYSILILPLFLIFGLLNIYNSNNLNKVISMTPFLIFAVSILLLSLGGLPPLTGFAPKMMTIFLLVNVNSVFVMFLILGSILNLCFYLNIIMNLMLTSHSNLSQNSSLSSMKWVNSFFVFSIVSLLFILLLH
uniref:NADH dehydrogenase subunit 2 n=1 Tax=Drawida gisti TaxID=1189287 RepID=UPI001D02A11C|nr:NADH dehydrogenase subunit 2 [Drawida gisti]QVG61476.1 NADH dehydrogenase subunit 2 [Drawida gisti]